jgi:gluconokinase
MILIVAGVAGSGKTTVGEIVAGKLGWTFIDADDFHSDANIRKMQAGMPLTDEDRLPWLRGIRAWIDKEVAAGKPGVVACSALKRSYRQSLMSGCDQVVMAFLTVTWHEDEERMLARKGHFFAEPLLASQFAVLEMPESEERVRLVSSDGRPADQVADGIIAMFKLA